MSKHLHVVYWFPLLFIVIFLTYWIQIYVNTYVDLEEYLLSTQVNYATDSAIAEMLENSTTDADYAEGDFLLVEPSLAFQDFCYCMARNLGIAPTEQSINILASKYLRSMIVVAYDGVYGFYGEKVDTTNRGIVQTPKIPYFYTAGNDQYCLTLNQHKGYVGTYDGTSFLMERYNLYPDGKEPTSDLQSRAIIDTIAELLNWTLAESYGAGKTDMVIDIPATSQNLRNSVNSISTPTCIVVFEGNRSTFGVEPIAEVIGGSSVEDADHAVGYTFNGQLGLTGKYYATTSWWEKHQGLAATLSDAQYFDSVFDAATAGYNDISYFD